MEAFFVSYYCDLTVIHCGVQNNHFRWLLINISLFVVLIFTVKSVSKLTLCGSPVDRDEILLKLLCFYDAGVLGATHVEIEHHLEMGRKLLAAGQLAEALSHYHSAVGKVTHTGMQTYWHTFIFLPLADICNPYPHT